MAIEPAVFVPALAVGHVLGVLLLIYGLEKVYGVIRKARRRFLSRITSSPSQDQVADQVARLPRFLAKDDHDETDSSPCTSECSFDSTQGKAAAVRVQCEQPVRPFSDPWTRGCSSQGPSSHKGRWKPRHAADRDEENLAAFGSGNTLLVHVPVDLAWSNLACKVVDKHTMVTKHILHATSGSPVPGEMMALVGPSGAGKSTLLDILAQRKGGNVSGQVWLNGAPVGGQFKQVSAYVAQEEMFVPTLSCWETLQIHAALRNHSHAPAAALEKRMQDVLSVMGLWRVRDTQVGGILAGGITVRGLSGGEKRRLSIACALIARPSLLFLDEPTTGLDSFAALNVMEHLSSLAALGHTVVASIHQPQSAIWDMFPKVLVLSEGHQLYFGPPQEVVDWFDKGLGYSFWPDQHGAVSDWLMDLVSVGFSKPQALSGVSMTSAADVASASELWQAHYCKVASTQQEEVLLLKDNGAEEEATTNKLYEQTGSRFVVSWGTQFWWLLKRSLVSQLRNPTDVTSRLLLSCWIGLLAGLVFYDLDDGPAAAFQRMSVLYFTMLLFELLPFCYMSFYVWDRKFFLSDRASDLYSTSAYYMAHMAASLPFILVNTLCGAFAAYGFAGLRYTPAAIVLYGVIMVLQSLIAIQVMVFCVYVSSNQDIAYVLATGYVGLSILLSSFFVRPSQLRVAPLLWLSYLSYPRRRSCGDGTKGGMRKICRAKRLMSAMAPSNGALRGWPRMRRAAACFGRQAARAVPPQISPAVPRWCFQGLAWNKLAGIVYPPGITCIDTGMPGASDAQIRQVMSNPVLAREALAAGFTCQPASTGDAILSYWELHLTAPEVIGFLVGVYALFHVMSYMALTA